MRPQCPSDRALLSSWSSGTLVCLNTTEHLPVCNGIGLRVKPCAGRGERISDGQVSFRRHEACFAGSRRNEGLLRTTRQSVYVAGLGLSTLTAFRGSIALVGTVAYVAFFALGAGAVPGLLVPEITPARLRGETGRATA